MADAVTTQVLFNGEKKLIVLLTNISDGTGESAVSKIAAATYGSNLRIMGLKYSTFGMAVRLLWDADADVPAWLIPSDADGCHDFSSFGGLKNAGGDGVTGNISLTTVGHTSGDTYSIILELAKS